MDIDQRPNGQPSPTNVPYIVKIEELWFDANQPVGKFIDVGIVSASMGQQLPGPISVQALPGEPVHEYGLPPTTMRMLEMSEGVHALGPIMDFVKVKNTTPIGECFRFEYYDHN
jgi:hypothetical protein